MSPEGAQQEQSIASAGDPDVEQAALLGHRFTVVEGAVVRQEPLVEADDEDRRELEPLGGVQRQQDGGVHILGERVLVGDERHLFQEHRQVERRGGELRWVVVDGGLAGQTAQLQNVLPSFGAFVAAIVEETTVGNVLDDAVEESEDSGRRGHATPAIELFPECGGGGRRARREVGRGIGFPPGELD
ncbi:MAG: hypothetical protein HW404_891, partial [Anaerolineales bacterium]|nr:hypothetical protein [Anaerolineales bacterium]